MPVQDDERERELVRMFNLDWDPAHQRSGVDATLDLSVGGNPYQLNVEVKSTTADSVSTARDVGMKHIDRWRRMLFVIGYYTGDAKRPELKHCLCLTPLDLEPWIKSIEDKILPDFKLAERASRVLTLDDLFAVCGEQETYTLNDAKRLHKRQWTAAQYKQSFDVMNPKGKPHGISQGKMLEILRSRAKYIAERGATLNNPHIDAGTLTPFFQTDRLITMSNSAAQIRKIAADFLTANPRHPAAVTRAESTPITPVH